MRALVTVLLAAGLACAALAQETAGPEPRASWPRDSDVLAAELERHPLRPPGTSSPRATLESFIVAIDLAFRIVQEAHVENRLSPGIFNNPASVEKAREALQVFQHAFATLDLSQVPKTLREDVGTETALMLKEILDRIELPRWEDVPDENAIAAIQSSGGQLATWRLPNTDIEIARVEEGSRAGEFLFTPETVARMTEFYARARQLPYSSEPFVTAGLYDFYISTPGRMLPPKWSRWLPEWSNELYYDQTVWQWFALVLLLVLALAFLLGASRFLRFRVESASMARRRWGRAAFYIVVAVTTAVLYYVLDDEINVTGGLLIVLGTTLESIMWLALAFAAFFVFSGTSEHLIESPRVDTEGIQASYLRAIFGLAGFAVGATITIYGLREVGVSLIPLLTGVGIGGLAIALAARPTIENIIGSFMIFADKPYRVGQRVKAMGQDGFVETIGLRSTTIRLMNGHLASIPNEKMATAEIENVGLRKHILRSFDITVTYDTSPADMHRAVQIVKDILAVPEAPEAGRDNDEHDREPHPNEGINQPGLPPRVFFTAFNADSLNILVMYWFHPPRRWAFYEHAQWINMQILERFNAAGIDFAFPTQTLHLAGDDKRPLTIGRRWVSEDTEISHSAVLAQAAAIGARTALAGEGSVSEATRPRPAGATADDVSERYAPSHPEETFADDAGPEEHEGGDR